MNYRTRGGVSGARHYYQTRTLIRVTTAVKAAGNWPTSIEGTIIMLRVTVYGKSVPESYHFTNEHDMVTWFLAREDVIEVRVTDEA